MAQSYHYKTLIDSRDVDGHGQCRASALLGHMQEAATQAAEYGGFGREVIMGRHNGFWMLTRMWYQIKRPLRWNEELTVHTWHRGVKGAVSYRDYDLYIGDEWVGEGVSAWVLANADTHKLIRLSSVTEMAETHGGDLRKEKTLNKLKVPTELDCIERRMMRYSDTDINGHVNNTRYADFVCDALRMDKLPMERFLAEVQIGYLKECHPGEVLDICTGICEDGRTYLCGQDEEGLSRFDAAIVFGEIEKEKNDV